MKHLIKNAFLAASLLSVALAASAADISGKWSSEFESQVGHLKYVFDLKSDSGRITGTAHRESAESKSDAEIQNGKIDGNNVSFSETLHVQDRDIPISYTGKLNGNDEMKLTRQVGD